MAKNVEATSSNLLTIWEATWGIITSTDNVGIINDAVLTWDASRPLNQIRMGENGDASAAPAGQRVGSLIIPAGITLTFDGSTNPISSGIEAVPASTGAESVGCDLTINGTAANPVVLTNSAGGCNANNEWCINMQYGNIIAFTYVTMKYCSYDGQKCIVLPVSNSYSEQTTFELTGPIVYYCGAVPSAQTIRLVSFYSHATNNLNIGMVTIDATDIVGSVYFNISDNGGFNCVGDQTIKYIKTQNTAAGKRVVINPFNRYFGETGVEVYTGSSKIGPTNWNPTETVPIGLTLTNQYDGTVKVEVSNFAAGTYLIIYDGSGDPVYAISYEDYIDTRTRKPANCGIIAGVPLTEISTWMAKYTSDLFVFSAACAAAGAVTPTFLPAAANVIAPNQYGQGGTEFQGTGSSGGGSNKTIKVG